MRFDSLRAPHARHLRKMQTAHLTIDGCSSACLRRLGFQGQANSLRVDGRCDAPGSPGPRTLLIDGVQDLRFVAVEPALHRRRDDLESLA